MSSELKQLMESVRKEREVFRAQEYQPCVPPPVRSEWDVALESIHKTEASAELLAKMLNAPIAWTAVSAVDTAPPEDPSLSQELQAIINRIVWLNVCICDYLEACLREVRIVKGQIKGSE
ncbi:MAG: hypothetical protein WC683_18270 [bacterium]